MKIRRKRKKRCYTSSAFVIELRSSIFKCKPIDAYQTKKKKNNCRTVLKEFLWLVYGLITDIYLYSLYLCKNIFVQLVKMLILPLTSVCYTYVSASMIVNVDLKNGRLVLNTVCFQLGFMVCTWQYGSYSWTVKAAANELLDFVYSISWLFSYLLNTSST